MKGSGLSETRRRGEDRASRARYSESSVRWVVVLISFAVFWRVV